jgi:hypothetical protein
MPSTLQEKKLYTTFDTYICAFHTSVIVLAPLIKKD